MSDSWSLDCQLSPPMTSNESVCKPHIQLHGVLPVKDFTQSTNDSAAMQRDGSVTATTRK